VSVETKATHTPGPWRFDEAEERVVNSDHGAIADLYARGNGDSEMLPNARLIAAAPDLLAACRLMLDEFSEWERPEEPETSPAAKARNDAVRAYEACRAAIEKAEGL